jgi:hypothetical protein
MRHISRPRRAELQRDAHAIRQRGQRAGRNVQQIAGDIEHELDELRPLEVWRLAYGWTRSQVIAAIAALYEDDGLASPPVNSAMLCRWEHGARAPTAEYRDALARLYRVSAAELGLARRNGDRAGGIVGDDWYGRCETATMPRDGDNGAAALAAIRESIQLALDVEGPAGGPRTCEHIDHAIDYYALNYARFAPGTLAGEVHRCRGLVTRMLEQPQPDVQRRELRRHAGWLSALIGNLALPPRRPHPRADPPRHRRTLRDRGRRAEAHELVARRAEHGHPRPGPPRRGARPRRARCDNVELPKPCLGVIVSLNNKPAAKSASERPTISAT